MTIASIDEEDIKYFEEEVKNGNVSKHFENVKEDDVLEGSNKIRTNFEFTRGHVKFLIAIRDFLKNHLDKHGPDSFALEKGINENPVASKKKSMKRKRSTKEHRDTQYSMQN